MKENKKLPKVFPGKNLRMTQKKSSHADFVKKDLTWCVKNRCAHGC